MRVQFYLADAYDLRKEKKLAAAATDRGIEAAQHSLQLNEKSADTHALLADLYAHRIGYRWFLGICSFLQVNAQFLTRRVKGFVRGQKKRDQ